MKPLFGWTPTEPPVLAALLDRVARLCDLDVNVTDWANSDDDDGIPEFTPWEEALAYYEHYFEDHRFLDWPSRIPQQWAARRAVDPARFDRWAGELAFGAYGLAKAASCGGSGDPDEDARHQRAELADLARRLDVLTFGPLTETRWPRHSEPAGRLLFHWQAIGEPPGDPHAVGIDEGIIDLVTAAWDAGLRTQWCCQADRPGCAYITFASRADAGAFAAMLPPGCWELEDDASTVHFPARLIDTITKRVAGVDEQLTLPWP